MAQKLISVKIVIDRLMRHPMLQDMTLETVVDYTVDFMRIVGVPSMFSEKVDKLEVKQYRAELPCDFLDLIQVRFGDHSYAMRESTDSFYMKREHDPHIPINNGSSHPRVDPTFKIQGNYIFVDKAFGHIEIAYQALSTDEDGFPMVPDNSIFLRALESYVKRQYFTILFDMGKIQGPVYQNAKQEYAFNVAQVETEFNQLTLSKMESLMNAWTALLPRQMEFQRGFDTLGAKERLRIKR